MYGTAYVPTYYTVLRTVRYCVLVLTEILAKNNLNVSTEILANAPINTYKHGPAYSTKLQHTKQSLY